MCCRRMGDETGAGSLVFRVTQKIGDGRLVLFYVRELSRIGIASRVRIVQKLWYCTGNLIRIIYGGSRQPAPPMIDFCAFFKKGGTLSSVYRTGTGMESDLL